VTPRRWLRLANPALADAISQAIGDNWIVDHGQLRGLRPLAADRAFRGEFLKAKRTAKARFAGWLKAPPAGRRSGDDVRLPGQTHS